MPEGQATSTLSALVARPKSEVEAEIILRIIARPAHHFVDLAVLPAGHFYASPDGRAVRACAYALDHDPVVLVSAIVAQQRGRPVQVIDDHIHVAVIVEIPEGTAASDVLSPNGRPSFRGHVFETPVPKVAIQNLRLLVGDDAIFGRRSASTRGRWQERDLSSHRCQSRGSPRRNRDTFGSLPGRP